MVTVTVSKFKEILGLKIFQATIVHFRDLIFVAAQLNRRENQPDRMTMIAIADGNQVNIFY